MIGKFITFEGVEGVGKTTNLNFVAEKLKAKGYSVLVTREPGGTQMGEEIRDILLAHRHEEVSPVAELLLMFAARAQHIERIIRPALQEGKMVLCDRFTDASYAYQGGGRNVDKEKIQSLEQLVQGTLRPDYTFLLDAPPEIGLKRAKNRSHADRFEKEEVQFFERVRASYLERAKQYPERYAIVDASRTIQEVQKVLEEELTRLLVKEESV